jgi:glycosyltransferase involved in cell wall biosynthesis
MMRIAVWHNLPSGGGKRALYDHVRGLLDAGHEVEAWAPQTRDAGYLPLTDLIPEHIVPVERPVGRTFAEKLQWRSYSDRVIAAMDDHCRQCAAEIDAGGFDVLFANSCMFLRTTSIGRFTSLPSVLYLQEPYRWLYEAMPDLIWAAAPRDASLRSRFVNNRHVKDARVQVREEINNAKAFDRILCNSYFSREGILRSYGIEAEVCYLGIDVDHFRPRNLPRDNFVIGLGAFTREKNMRLCIEALGLVAEPRPTLRWIGNVNEPTYLEEMRTLAAARGVVLETRERVSEEELLDTLCRATAMIYAPRLEPLGLAPLEASASGTPVVAVAEAGVRETVRNDVNGLLVDGRPASIAAAIQSLLDDPSLGRRLGEQGRALVEREWALPITNARLTAKLVETAAASRTATAA